MEWNTPSPKMMESSTYPLARETLVFSVWLDPCKDKDYILDVNFLRNLSGYLNDCLKAGLKPSVLQIILFTENTSSLLCPPFLN
ncbi:hypothetical protein Aspvir_005013 [Aspergillus viridinutans]|uniref:Uncharacterized protein n=1 Tax=Aspergillus viridinutans TaxID=75553 RepID=A0A9P3BR50_ASPVI|nr:uncharacterized protein Aspvir_005013 [Aspergillus viridinutans]GIK00983.1 hypothetical protein Aspvir_005013 [Aspergillus viridinutans]